MNYTIVYYGSHFLDWLVLLSQIFIIVLFLSYLLKKTKIKLAEKLYNYIIKLATPNAKLIAFSVVLVSMLGSLFFEHIAGYTPCELCWWQRIFMYPQVFLFGLSFSRKKDNIFPYALVLSIIGIFISAYHYILQMYAIHTPGFTSACSLTGASCSSTQIVPAFGYITIPLMAFTGFLLVIIMFFIDRRKA